jgi:hypothetical protein
MIHPMTRISRYVLTFACLLLLVAVVPPQPAYPNGDPDEVVERIPPRPPIIIGDWPTPGDRGGDPDEFTGRATGDPGEGPTRLGVHGDSYGRGWWLALSLVRIVSTLTP